MSILLWAKELWQCEVVLHQPGQTPPNHPTPLTSPAVDQINPSGLSDSFQSCLIWHQRVSKHLRYQKAPLISASRVLFPSLWWLSAVISMFLHCVIVNLFSQPSIKHLHHLSGFEHHYSEMNTSKVINENRNCIWWVYKTCKLLGNLPKTLSAITCMKNQHTSPQSVLQLKQSNCKTDGGDVCWIFYTRDG